MNQENTQTIEMFTSDNCQAEEYIAAGKLPEAAGLLVTIVQKDPDNWRAYNNMGILSWSRNNWFDAFAMFKQSVTLKPDYNDALINLFDASLKLKKISESLPYFEKALQVNPELEEIKIIRDQIIKQGDEIYFCKRALQIGTYSPLITEAQKSLENGNYNKALELFLKSNDTEGHSAAAFCGMGIVAFYKKNYTDAYSLFLESLKLNPLDTDTFLNLLDAAKACGKTDEAKKVFEIYQKEIPELSELAPAFQEV
jgi:tetratricopeptide (TPR) repeat protein